MRRMLNLYNTLTRRRDPFEPIEPPVVKLYTCGPTVYNFAHLGNFRAYVFEDILRRTLEYKGYRVIQVMNLTDVDDKTIRGAMAAGICLDAFTQPFKEAFFDDLQTLRITPAEHYPAATRHIPEMIALIERLLARNHAYLADDGCVYFNIASYPDYGRLARLDLSSLQSGARVTHDEYAKDHAADFALWKAWDAEDGEVAWDSPWGRGRPGWHIECSAMSMRYLGETFDIHTGGIDNIFPHHEDEIAQSEAATGNPLARFWLHCAHLIVDGRKMSKSVGNFHTLREVIDMGFHGREIRYLLASAHYRQTLNFTFDGLRAVRAALERLDTFRQRLQQIAGDREAPPATRELPDWAQRMHAQFEHAIGDDLNTAAAYGAVFETIHEGNRAMDHGRLADATEAAAILRMLNRWDRILGIMEPDPVAGDPARDPVIAGLLKQRQAAREIKDFKTSDHIRDLLRDKGWMVRDTPHGQELKRI